jgi:hypothetical protein
MKRNRDEMAIILTYGAIALILIIAIGSFGRAFFLAVVTHEDHQISDAATQLLTSLGSALVGGVIGFLGNGKIDNSKDEDKAE